MPAGYQTYWGRERNIGYKAVQRGVTLRQLGLPELAGKRSQGPEAMKVVRGHKLWTEPDSVLNIDASDKAVWAPGGNPYKRSSNFYGQAPFSSGGSHAGARQQRAGLKVAQQGTQQLTRINKIDEPAADLNPYWSEGWGYDEYSNYNPPVSGEPAMVQAGALNKRVGECAAVLGGGEEKQGQRRVG